MNKIAVALALGLIGLGARGANAEARYQSPGVMIANADAIAVVNVETVEKTEIQGEYWTYGQKAMARVEQTLKGTLPTTPVLLGDENFICASCHFETGRFLVFLKRGKEGWEGNNWQPSVRKIENGLVSWNEKDLFGTKPVPLAEAVENIQATLDAQKKAPSFELIALEQEDKTRLWSIAPESGVAQTMKQSELERWLWGLAQGSKISLLNGCRRANASPEEVEKLKSFAYYGGLDFKVVPAG